MLQIDEVTDLRVVLYERLPRKPHHHSFSLTWDELRAHAATRPELAALLPEAEARRAEMFARRDQEAREIAARLANANGRGT